MDNNSNKELNGTPNNEATNLTPESLAMVNTLPKIEPQVEQQLNALNPSIDIPTSPEDSRPIDTNTLDNSAETSSNVVPDVANVETVSLPTPPVASSPEIVSNVEPVMAPANPLEQNNIQEVVEIPTLNATPEVAETAIPEVVPSVPPVIAPAVPVDQNANGVSNPNFGVTTLNSAPVNNSGQVVTPVTAQNPPDVINVGGLPEETTTVKKKSNKSVIIIILIILILAGAGVYVYFNYFAVKKIDIPKTDVTKTSYNGLQIKRTPEIGVNFENTYNVSSGSLGSFSTSDDAFYLVNDEGKIEFNYGDKSLKLSLKNETITAVSCLSSASAKDVIAISVENNIYYIASIKKDITSDIELTKDNSNLITFKAENVFSINKGTIESAQKNQDFYVVVTSDSKYYLKVDKDNNGSLIELTKQFYEGVNIDLTNANFNSDKSSKIKIDGIGIHYDQKVFTYTGKIGELTEKEILIDTEKSFTAKEMILGYDPDFKYVNLYIINEIDDTNYLYILNLLDDSFVAKKYSESALTSYGHMSSNSNNTINFEFEDGSKLNVPENEKES